MSNQNVSTGTMLERLFKTSNITRFIKSYDDGMKQPPFHIHITKLCEEKGAVRERVILKSGIARTYGYQFFGGARKPSRDKTIQLAFGFEMHYEETQALLKAARKSPLNPKIERDAVVIFALTKKYSVVETQIILGELELPLLGKEDRYG
jgi:hypothetical protein